MYLPVILLLGSKAFSARTSFKVMGMTRNIEVEKNPKAVGEWSGYDVS